MYAKSFLASNPAGRLTGTRTALRSPSGVYICHHCGSALVLHAEAVPWYEHIGTTLTERGRQLCPYVHPAADEALLIQQLRRYLQDVRPIYIHEGQPLGPTDYREEDLICS